jgi:DNA polymerase III epsilon subunit-like protein
MKTLREINQEYHFEKERLRQWLINKEIDAPEEIYDLVCDQMLEDYIKEEQYVIRHTPIRKKYQLVDEYEAPELIPMPFTILNIHDCVILDTETTGLYKDDEIVELSVLDMLGHELYHSLFKPEKKMGKAAIRVTGLDHEQLAHEPLFKDEWRKIKKAIGKKRIIGHNVAFDYRITVATALRYGIEESEVKRLFYNMIDSKEIAKKYIKTSSYKLEDLCRLFHITDPQKHRATYDCLMTLQMLRALENHLINRGITKESLVYDPLVIKKEKEIMNNRNKAIIYSYKAEKSITDISLFFGVSCDEIVDIIIEEYKKEEFVLHVDKEIEEKVIFLTRGKQTLEECLQATGKYVPSYLVKLVLLKRGFDYE